MAKVKLLVPEDSFDFFVVRMKRRGPIRAWACVAVCDGGVVYEFDCMTIDEGMTLLGLGRLLERSITETIEGRFV